MRNKHINLLVITLLMFTIFAVPDAAAQDNFTIDFLNLVKSVGSTPFLPLSNIKIDKAWELLNNSSISKNPVKIGIIDSGIDASGDRHPEFRGIKLGNTSADAFTDSAIDLGTLKKIGHGTQVTGIIGANNISFPDPTKYLSPQMNGILSGAHGLDYVLEIRKPTFFGLFFNANAVSVAFQAEKLLQERVDIINISMTSAIPTPKIVELTNKIYSRAFSKGQDTLFVVSAGQFDFLDLDGVNAESVSPASLGNDFSNVITVGATNPLDDTRMSSSNFGGAVGIAAPGLPAYAPAPRGKGNFPDTKDYENSFGGTSASAPMVTGVAGLIKAIKPGLTPAQIKDILIRNADSIQTDKPIGGRLNALKAVCDPLVLNCAPTPPPQPSNTWQSVGPMTVERAEHTSTLLNDGRVLITGGFKGSGSTFSESASAEVFNPSIGTFSLVGGMSTPRAFHTATLLPNGKVLIVGGTKDGGNTILNSAELFDPQTNTFISISNSNQKRFLHTANILPDGKVLIAGGFNGQPLKSTEIFDLSTNTFSSGNDMIIERAHHSSARLNDGRILLVNGLQIGSLMTVEIYNPNANAFTLATSSAFQLGLGAVTLPSGNVFISGSTLSSQPAGLGAEIFNPNDSSFTEVGPMLLPIDGSGPRLASVILNDGAVLVTGGGSKAQIFNPQTSAFKLTGDLNIPRLIRHRLTLLQDGRALLTGGQLSPFGFITTNGAEVFKP